ncbi:MAG: hypothetical protein HY324_03465, partial [Chlamydiia bacterium]|nr:hypothetical protein [Chlamydiia bacterium]
TGATGGGSILSNNADQHTYGDVSSSFTCNLDFVDAILARSYYVGKNLVFQSALGARGAWITENFINTFAGGVQTSQGTNSNYQIGNNSEKNVQRVHSWAVGPRAGVEMDWDLGEGVRFFGNTFLDVLYTKYKVQDKVSYNVTVTASQVATTKALSVTNRDIVKALRAHIDTELGFGWGMYFDNNAWHVDLSAAYGFQVFFNQNMFSASISQPVYGGNLYIHGLTATARVDF